MCVVELRQRATMRGGYADRHHEVVKTERRWQKRKQGEMEEEWEKQESAYKC